MAKQAHGLLGKFLHNQSLRRWARFAARAPKANMAELSRLRGMVSELRRHLDRVTYVADERLALPRIGSNSFPRPRGTDWAWRPELWRGGLPIRGIAAAASGTKIGEEVTLFHDCRISELSLRQIRNTREADLAAYGLRMDVFRFDGSFLSLVIDLPPDACEGLRTTHLIRIDPIIELEKPIEVFARLNIKHGPNIEPIVRELPRGGDSLAVEFDLAYLKLNEKRIEKIWLDLIFEGPEMNEATIRDITFCRYPRAQL